MSSDLTAYVRSNRERYEQEFVDFLRIPSVSTEKRYADDVSRCAEWLADIVREAGMDNVEIIPTEGNPFVVADKIVDPDAPTVLVYGHYDVQPVDPEELWDAPPFEPTFKDGRIYYLKTMSSNPSLREERLNSDDKRLFMNWQGGDRVKADIELLKKAGVPQPEDGMILHFYDPATEQALARLELERAGGRPVEQIRRTRFQVKRAGNGYEFVVTSQKLR